MPTKTRHPKNHGCKTEAKKIADIPKLTRKLSKAKNKQGKIWFQQLL